MVSVKIILVFMLVLNTSKCEEDAATFVRTRKLNGHIELGTLEVVSSPEPYLEWEDNERGSDKRVEHSYLLAAEVEITNKLAPATLDAQKSLLSEHTSARLNKTFAESDISLEDTPGSLDQANELISESLVTEKGLRTVGRNLKSRNIEEEIEDINSFIKLDLDPNLQEATTVQQDLNEEVQDVASILNDEGMTEDYDMIRDFETNVKLKRVEEILSKTTDNDLVNIINDKEVNEDTNEDFKVFTTTTVNPEMNTVVQKEEANNSTDEIEDFTELPTTTFPSTKSEEPTVDIMSNSKFDHITTEKQFEAAKSTAVDGSKQMGNEEKVQLQESSSEGINKFKMFVVGKNDYDATAIKEVENFYNKDLDNYDDFSEEDDELIKASEEPAIEIPHQTSTIASARKNKVVLPRVVGIIFGNLANLTISIEKKGKKIYVPGNATIKQTYDKINIYWNTQDNGLYDSIVFKAVESSEYYVITEISLLLQNDKEFNSSRTKVLLIPISKEETYERMVELDDGVKLVLSDITFLRKKPEENPSNEEQTWRIDILIICISNISLIVAAVGSYAIYKIRTTKRKEITKC